ncbi:MAG: helix-turn-helix transcriptional regulator [Acidobacteriota bacterium]
MSTNEDFHNFVLVLSGVSEPDERLENALFEAGCDDATLAFRNRVGYLEFDRRARSLEAAILSAVRDVERADPRLTVVSVEPGDFVNASEIARRVQVTREYIRLLVQGKRGEGEFPAPQSGITGKTLVWSWAEVVRWMLEHNLLEDRAVIETAETIRDINDALEMRQHPATMDRRLKYLRELQKSKSKGGTRS